LEDGFTLSKFISAQTALHKCTSVTVTNGVRVEGTSIPLSPPPSHNSDWGDKKSAFCYRISVENVGDHMVVLIGRHWRIHDNGSNLLHMEIPKGSPGVVGHRYSSQTLFDFCSCACLPFYAPRSFDGDLKNLTNA